MPRDAVHSSSTCLALEFSGKTASLAVIELLAGKPVTTTQVLSEGKNHLEQAITLIDEVLLKAGKQLADVSVLIAPSSPGSFTGLRVGLATAKGLARRLEIPLCTVSGSEARALHWCLQNQGTSVEVYTPASSSRTTRSVFAFKDGRVERGEEAVVEVKDVGPANGVERLVEETLVIDGGIRWPLRAEMLGACLALAHSLKRFETEPERALVEAEYFGTRF